AYAVEHPESRGLGTTATIAGLLGDTLYLAQVGDSRAYLVRKGVALQITKDQSLMQRLIEAGELTPEEAERSERRNIILQALGPEPSVKIDLTYQKVRKGDTLVLCTDGLSGLVRKDEIAEILQESNDDLLTACRELIDRANENGGPDNITVIAARFDGSRLNPPGTADEVGHRVFPLPETGQTAAVTAEAVSSEPPLRRLTDVPSLDVEPEVLEPVLAPPMDALGSRSTPSEAYDFSTATTPVAGSPTVSPTRRQTGMLIAVALLVALVATAVWFVVRTAERVSPAADSGRSITTQPAPAPTPRG
ncbi:MAG TPA: hypothetical protein VGH98_16255, partial [Gemmatimonadaceae bacterium]